MRRQLLRLRFWITFGLAAGALTCSGFGRIAISQSSTTVIQQGTLVELLAQDLGFGEFVSMDIAQNQELANQGVSRNQITTVFVTFLGLEITAPTGQDFGFIDSLEFFVEAPGEERQRIASWPFPDGETPAGETSVELTLDEGVDLAPYVAAESMTITTEAGGRRPGADTTVEALISFDVGFDVGGAVCGGGG